MVGVLLAGLTAGRATLAIAGGTEVEPCQWPGTVAVLGDVWCTGFLVHPEVVLYAAHCGAPTEVRFGQDRQAPELVVPAQCEPFPLFDQEVGGNDYAMCRLSEAVDVPFAPVIRGCETAMIRAGHPVTLVGFGEALDGTAGVKRAVETTVDSFPVSTLAYLGGDGVGSCAGDSGGPAFVRLDDGTLRAFAVTSGVMGGQCGAVSVHVLLDPVIDWVEFATGIDITACHDEGGGWEPTPACAGAVVDAAAGEWGDQCGETARSGVLASCGDPFAAGNDGSPPVVTVIEPTGDVELVGGLHVVVDATDEGQGVRAVWLEVDGVVALDDDGRERRDETVPYEFFGVAFEDGAHELAVVAEDWAGNRGVATVQVRVGDDPQQPGPGEDSESGDGCRVGGGGSWWVALLCVVLGTGSARRRRRSQQRPRTRKASRVYDRTHQRSPKPKACDQ